MAFVLVCLFTFTAEGGLLILRSRSQPPLPLFASRSRPLQPSPEHISSRSFFSPRSPTTCPFHSPADASPSETLPPSVLLFGFFPKVSPYTSRTSRDKGSLSAIVHHKLQDTTQKRSGPYCVLKGTRRLCPGGGRGRALSQAASADGPPGRMQAPTCPASQWVSPPRSSCPHGREPKSDRKARL